MAAPAYRLRPAAQGAWGESRTRGPAFFFPTRSLERHCPPQPLLRFPCTR